MWDLSNAAEHRCKNCGEIPDTQEKADDWEYGYSLCGPCFTAALAEAKARHPHSMRRSNCEFLPCECHTRGQEGAE